MEEFLDSLELSYEQDVIEAGKRNQEVKFDFRVHGETTTSLIQSLSAASASSAHSIATEAFVRLYDIGAAKAPSGLQYVTVVDESHNVFKEYDVERLNSLSSVFWFQAEQEQLTAALVS